MLLPGSSASSDELRGAVSDGDEDSFLAAAAEEAEARDHTQAKKHGLRSLFAGPSEGRKSMDEPRVRAHFIHFVRSVPYSLLFA